MANEKISAMDAADTPLGGTETVPIVQDGENKKATVAQIRGDASDLDEADLPLDGDEIVVVTQDSEKKRATVNQLQQEIIQFSCSDLTTELEAATDVGYVRAARAFKLTDVRASLLTGSSSGAVTIDINKNGTTVLSTKLTIDEGEKTSKTAATPAVISDSAIAEDDLLTVDIDGAGSGAKGLIVTLIGRPSA